MDFKRAVAAIVLMIPVAAAVAEAPYALAWGVQQQSVESDYADAMALDAQGSIIVGGVTGLESRGGYMGGRAYVAKYAPDGSRTWERELAGGLALNFCRSVAADRDGNIYAVGYAGGAIPGAIGSGGNFLAKYDAAGGLQWVHQSATGGADLAIDQAGNAFVLGVAPASMDGLGGTDLLLSKYNPAGELQWTRRSGTAYYDDSWSLAIDAHDNLFIAGTVHGELGGQGTWRRDAFLAEYDADGQRQWLQQQRMQGDPQVDGVAVDAAGFAFIAGVMNLPDQDPAGPADAFISRYDPDGNVLWTSLLGEPEVDQAMSVAVDGNGNAYMCGFFGLDLVEGDPDMLLAKYDRDGNRLWLSQLAVPESEDVWFDAAVDTAGAVYVAGGTGGDLFGTNLNPPYGDTVLVKYVVPEPGSLAMLAAGAMLARKRRRDNEAVLRGRACLWF